MTTAFLAPFVSSSFHIVNDLVPLAHMVKVMSRTVSAKARQRLAWMDAYRESGNAQEVCRHYAIAPRTFWYWKERFDPWDLTSLEDRSRRPCVSPRRTSQSIEHQVLTMKQTHPRWGKRKVAMALRRQGCVVSPSTILRLWHRHGQVVHYRTRKRRAPKPRVNWAEVRLPGDLWQIDTKFVSVHGRPCYQYTAIDVISRWRHADVYPSCDMATTIAFLASARARFGRAVIMVQSDNGKEFGRSVSRWLNARHIRHVFSHKARPQENAYVERSHRTDEEEFWSLGACGTWSGCRL